MNAVPEPCRSRSRSLVRAGASYFALVFGAGFALALIRIPLLVPRLGERVAELLELPVMLAVIYLASRHVVHRFALASCARSAVMVGGLALVLLLAAELAVAVVLQGRSVAEYVFDRDLVSGSAYLVSVMLYAAMPWLQARAAGRRTRGLPA